ncbi:MAG: sugar nucleotide-binding protein [Fibrobacteria bacterium]|nr:sugar nucleotide-binding protein [Fibrobacteria bacterium]
MLSSINKKIESLDFLKESRILVTGITSIHGWPIFSFFREFMPVEQLLGIQPPEVSDVKGDNVRSCCITDRAAFEKIKKEFNPTHLIHCGGVCDLDVCEERPDWAKQINGDGAKNLTEMFGEDCFVVYVSSDLVFSGENPPEGGYTEDCLTDPVSEVGKSYVQAEEEIKACKHYAIVRVALPLGDSVQGKKGAVDWITSRFEKDRPVTLFFDEVRSCISCAEIGPVITQILAHKLTGLFHLGGDEPWTLYEIGEYVLNTGGFKAELLKGMYREDEQDGPPRIGNVSLNSHKLNSLLKIVEPDKKE